MDQAGEELSRIISFVNRRPWIMEDNNSGCCLHGGVAASGESAGMDLGCSDKKQVMSKSNYFLDRLGVTTLGDSSLHRVCAWHTNPDQFQDFLESMEAHRHAKSAEASNLDDIVMLNNNSNYIDRACPLQDLTPNVQTGYNTTKAVGYRDMPDPPRLDQTNHRGVTALHVAVYRNAFYAHQIVKQLLQQQPSLASTPMTPCGSYPLHILCGQNLTIRKEVLMSLLQADPSVVWKEDINGDTPLSLLWKNVLRFRWAQQDHVTLQDDEEDVDDDIGSSSNSDSLGNSNNRRQRRRPSWMTVISPEQYVEYSLLLVRAALGKLNNDNESLNLGDVCRMPRCPPLLIRLLLQYPNKFVMVTQHEKDSQGMTPLHHAARVNAVTHHMVPINVLTKMKQSSVLDLVLHAFPSMACIEDRRGRIPLHYALDKDYPNNNNMNMVDGISLDDHKECLYRLVQANADSLGLQDPVTGLYPFALLASQKKKEPRDEDSMDIENIGMNESSFAGEMVHLEIIMVLLRHFPEAAVYTGH